MTYFRRISFRGDVGERDSGAAALQPGLALARDDLFTTGQNGKPGDAIGPEGAGSGQRRAVAVVNQDEQGGHVFTGSRLFGWGNIERGFLDARLGKGGEDK